MVKEVTRGHIRVEVNGRIATIPGEMFFRPGDKIGFVVYRDSIGRWDPPHEEVPIGDLEKIEIIDEIRSDFSAGGHLLVVE
ncbi:MAG TPA: Imm74 family immunity protein [Vulgatibacter sp.]